MKTLLQRVSRAAVTADGDVLGKIGPGLVVLACIEDGDSEEVAARRAGKIARLRIFSDADGKMNRSLIDSGGAVLVVSQFTLVADWRKGNRPGFSGAAPAPLAVPLLDHFCDTLKAAGLAVEQGRFGADMALELVNDGPVTIWMD